MDGDALVYRVVHDAKGPGFNVPDSPIPWSWKGMLVAMKPDDAARAVGPGIASVSAKRRRGSYDHPFAAVAASKGWSWPGSDLEPPPIIDFAFLRVDGSTMLVHPRRKKRAVDIVLQGQKPVGTFPAKGFGKSEGRGTFRRYKTGAYDADAAFEPGEAATGYPRVMGDRWGGPAVADQAAAAAKAAAAAAQGPAVAGPSGGGNVRNAKPPPPPPPSSLFAADAATPRPPLAAAEAASPNATATHSASPAVVGSWGGGSWPAVAGPSGGGQSDSPRSRARAAAGDGGNPQAGDRPRWYYRQ
jgi:hypothetical protein